MEPRCALMSPAQVFFLRNLFAFNLGFPKIRLAFTSYIGLVFRLHFEALGKR